MTFIYNVVNKAQDSWFIVGFILSVAHAYQYLLKFIQRFGEHDFRMTSLSAVFFTFLIYGTDYSTNLS